MRAWSWPRLLGTSRFHCWLSLTAANSLRTWTLLPYQEMPSALNKFCLRSTRGSDILRRTIFSIWSLIHSPGTYSPQKQSRPRRRFFALTVDIMWLTSYLCKRGKATTLVLWKKFTEFGQGDLYFPRFQLYHKDAIGVSKLNFAASIMPMGAFIQASIWVPHQKAAKCTRINYEKKGSLLIRHSALCAHHPPSQTSYPAHCSSRRRVRSRVVEGPIFKLSLSLSAFFLLLFSWCHRHRSRAAVLNWCWQ